MRPAAIIKLGGSYALSPDLGRALEAIALCGAPVVVVPGGGPFADAVRAAQLRMGFGDRAAHRMALLAMAQFAEALADLGPGLEVAESAEAIRAALGAKRVPVWSPLPMALGADLPESWDVTSDSLAVWLARALGAPKVVLLKSAEPSPGASAEELAAAGIVDPHLPRILGSGAPALAVLGPAMLGSLADIVAGDRLGSRA
ncbi:amino acid kinase family protein [Faunimonas sp. B44]|uniref:amino acid kinase family protein n=1 Tax=Faunimonas sp. B44 TaxID=3461493 RepID=UPI004044EACE